MAIWYHLKVLEKGVKVWNQWRRKHPKIRPDLSKTNLAVRINDLREVDLHEAYLGESNLQGIYLSNANLRGALLTSTDFGGADLSRADLSDVVCQLYSFADSSTRHANLSGINFSGANLYRANLSGAELWGADFSGADLTESDFSQSSTHLTKFGDIDLSTVIGLDTVIHHGPSTIGLDTIIRSKGKISETFLRKAGVSPSIIEQIPALIGSLSPIDYYTCFISYSNRDEDFAKWLYADLQNKGVRCWFAPHDMHIGDKIRYRIDESIRLHDKLLLVLSEHSVASQWVEHEVETALGKELEGKPNVLFPIRLDDKIMESKTGWASHIRLTRHIGDFTRWKNHDDYQQAFERLLRDLKAGA